MHLKNTPFYHPLDAIRHTEEPSLFDYEGSLDVYYFSYIWKQKDKLLKGKRKTDHCGQLWKTNRSAEYPVADACKEKLSNDST